MSQTPRKFSEKIAILERKNKAESDDFMSIMQDVRFFIKSYNSQNFFRSKRSHPQLLDVLLKQLLHQHHILALRYVLKGF